MKWFLRFFKNTILKNINIDIKGTGLVIQIKVFLFGELVWSRQLDLSGNGNVNIVGNLGDGPMETDNTIA